MIVGRIAKNSYTWYGRQRLEATLEELQRKGQQQGYHLQMELASKSRRVWLGREDDGVGDACCGKELRDKNFESNTSSNIYFQPQLFFSPLFSLQGPFHAFITNCSNGGDKGAQVNGCP